MRNDVQQRHGESSAVVVARVAISPEAAAVLRRLRARHGPLLIHQPGDRRRTSTVVCSRRGDYHLTADDMLLGLLYDAVPEPGRTEAKAVAGENPDLLTRRSIFAEVVTGDTNLAIPEHLTPVWVSSREYETRPTGQLVLDVVPGDPAGRDLEAVEGVRFVGRSRVFDEHAEAWLETCAP